MISSITCRLTMLFLLLAGVMLGMAHAQGRMENGETVPFHFLRAPRPVVIDGRLDEWVLTAPAAYEVDANADDRTARTYGMWDDQYLYLAYVVRDASPMVNTGDDPAHAFKTGDSLHFYVSTSTEVAGKTQAGGPEDYHVLMAVQKGKPVIFAFREKKDGVTKPTHIASPAQGIDIDWMGPVPGAVLAVEKAPDFPGYRAEVKLPLAFFDDFHPQAGRKVAVDAAVNFSDVTGSTNLAKVWWHRGATQILDVPTELRFDRNLWGTGTFLAAGQTPIIIDNKNTYAVPAPGAVTVDGDLADWDLSCAYGPQYVDPSLKENANVTWAMMYDEKNLYLGAIFNSAQQYHNISGVDTKWWEGDSLEFRLIADTKNQTGDVKANMDILTFGLWHCTPEKKDYIALQRSFKFLAGDISSAVVRSRETPTGRTFEAKIPWTIVQSGNVPKAGDAITCTLAAIWENGLRAFGMGSISSFRGINDWGKTHFLATGRQPMVFRNFYQPASTEIAINAGQFKTMLAVPRDGIWSAGVYSPEGRLLRTLFAGRPAKAGPVEIGWDGKDDLGATLPAGNYAVRAVVNGGLRVQYAVGACSPGQPPHASENPRRGWGGVWDNVKDIAADRTGIYPLWGMEEGDGGLLKIDDEGRLLWRQHLPLALPGTNVAVASNGTYVFVGVDDKSGKGGLWRVRCSDGGYLPFRNDSSNPLEFYIDGVKRTTTTPAGHDAVPVITGLAADAATLYVAAYYQDAIVCVDAETGKPARSLTIPQPRGICLDGPDHLLVVSGRQVVRLNLRDGKTTPVVTKSLDAPHDVAVDAKGLILVTDRGASQQVKRFDRAGKLLGTYGKPGGRTNQGKYQADRLRDPAGIAVAASGKIFVSEDAPPRVILRLSDKLRYEKLWAGPWYLSGEVTVDPQHPEQVYMWSHECFIRHVVDYNTKTSRPDAVWSQFALPMASYGRWFPRVIHHAGKTYLFCAGTNASLFRIDGDNMLLIAAVGLDRANKTQPMWVFTDLNENGILDQGEMVNFAPTTPDKLYRGSYWGGSVEEKDLTLYLYSGQTDVLALTPTFAKPGVPVYNFDTSRRIPLANAQKPGVKGNVSSIWQTPDGGVFGNADAGGSDPRGIGHSSHLSDVFIFRLDKDGNLLWRAGKKASGIAKNGEFYGRACGLGGPLAGEYFDFIDENGQDKIYTNDGLFVGNLLDDTATASPSEYTLFVEHFNSIVFQHAQNQRWYLVAGAGGYASIFEIVGLETIARVQGSIAVK